MSFCFPGTCTIHLSEPDLNSALWFRLYANLQSNQEWMDELRAADVIFVASHSQGSVVSTHLLDRLIRDNHIRTARNTVIGTAASESFPTAGMSMPTPCQPQRICCLALCGIHLGPLRYLKGSSLLHPYIQVRVVSCALLVSSVFFSCPCSVFFSLCSFDMMCRDFNYFPISTLNPRPPGSYLNSRYAFPVYFPWPHRDLISMGRCGPRTRRVRSRRITSRPFAGSLIMG